jgi:hypothetical protein
MEEKKHFSMGGNLSHAGVGVLPNGNDIEYIIIDHIEWRVDEVVNGVKKDTFVAIFAKNPYTNLPFVLNKENKSRLLKAAKKGEWDLLEIKNFPVRLTHELTKLGEGLRISKLPPKMPTTATSPAAPLKPAPKPAITEDNLPKAKEFLKTGTMEALKGFYEVSEEMEKKLTEIPTAE